MRLGGSARATGDAGFMVIGIITTVTTMDMGLTGLTTATVTGLAIIPTTMVVTVMPIPTGAVPGSVSGSASRTSVAECNSVAWEGGDLRVAPTF
jgi:hypothetical protein